MTTPVTPARAPHRVRCVTCDAPLPYPGYGRPRKWCDACVPSEAARKRAYIDAHRESVYANNRARNKANRDQINDRRRARRDANREAASRDE